MTTSRIVNGAPMTIMLGVNDRSTRQLAPEPEVLPTHLPVVFLYTQTGPTEPQLVVGDSLVGMYGQDSLDLRKAYATHQTVLAKTINAEGNSMMVHRMKPLDAPAPANVRISADVLPTSIPEYLRNSDGSVKVDSTTGLPVPSGAMIAGFKLKWVVDHIAPVEGESQFGLGHQTPGDQTDTVTNVQSVRYPVQDLEVPHFGKAGNNAGYRMWAPTKLSANPLDERIIQNEKVYPFRIAVVRRPDEISTPKIVETQSAEQFLDVCFKPGVVDFNTDRELYLGTRLIPAYEDLHNANGLPPSWGPFGRTHLYDDNVAALLTLFYTAELPYADIFSDLNGEEDELYRFNMISGVSSNNVPYHSFQVVGAASNAVRFTENSTVYASGGGDGTMTEALFADLVSADVAEYANPNSQYQDSATFPEAIIYDSGFPLATKYELCKFISVRKDTAVVLSTHDVLGRKLTASEESSLAIALRTRLQMFPESDFFGTPVLRGVIVGRSGILIGSQYNKRLPLTIEIAAKAARYMGAGNGVWTPGFAFDEDPNNEITMFSDINIVFTPATVRNKDWDNGLIWVEASGRRTVYIPAMKTIYNNDTSILTSFFTMMACVELEKVGERARRKFSGNSKLTKAQLVQRVNDFINSAVASRFDDRFTIVPETYFTTADDARGYSWTTKIKIYGPNMRTVGTLIIESYRIEDLTTTA